MGNDPIIEIEESCISNLVHIKNCPFCGEKPNVFRRLDDSYQKGLEMNWTVQCKSTGCIFIDAKPDRSLKNLLKNWNSRVCTTRSA